MAELSPHSDNVFLRVPPAADTTFMVGPSGRLPAKSDRTSQAIRDVATKFRLTREARNVEGSSTVETVAEFRARRRRTIAANIRYYRERAGISQEDLARQVGIRRTDYWRYEAGTHEPVRYLAAIATALDVTVEDLEGNHDEDEAA